MTDSPDNPDSEEDIMASDDSQESIESAEKPLSECNILIAGTFDDDHYAVIQSRLKDLGVQNIIVSTSPQDVVNKLEKSIDIMLYDGKLGGGPNFIEFLNHFAQMEGNKAVRCIISSDNIIEQEECGVKKETLHELQNILLPKIHALIVHGNKKTRAKIEQCLRETSVEPGSIQTAQNSDAGFVLASNSVLDRIKRGDDLYEIQEKVSLIFVENSKEGAALAQKLWNSDIYPAITVVTDGEDIDEAWGKIKDKPHSFSEMEMGELSVQNIRGRIPEAHSHLNSQRRQQYDKARQVIDEYESREQLIVGAKQLIQPPSIIIPKGNYLEIEKQLPDLRSPAMQDVLGAVLDLDGTLSDSFTMVRFVKDFTTPKGQSEFDKLLEELPKEYQERNRSALDRLNEEFNKWHEKQRKGERFTHQEYVEFIEDTDDLFAQMLQGLKAEDVFGWGEKWCNGETDNGNIVIMGDAEQHVWSHARPLIGLLKKVHIMPTLITGTMAEAVSGFRNFMGFDEKCHPMELYVENGRYLGTVKHHTGLWKSKAALMEKMSKIVFAAGDQRTDFPLLDRSLLTDKDNLLGFGIFFGEKGELIEKYTTEFGERRAYHIPLSDWGSQSIIELFIERMHGIMQDNLKRNLDDLTIRLVDRTRDKLEDFILNRDLIEEHMEEYKMAA